MRPIARVGAELGLGEDDLEPHGRFVAKLERACCAELAKRTRPDGRLVLVTAMSPTPAGEGKTTTAVGLADALRARGLRTVLCLREPSIGPCFGSKGGAAGG